MHEYRAYILGIDGRRFIRAAEFLSDYPDDTAALRAAEELVDGHDVELWDHRRLVVRIDKANANAASDDQKQGLGDIEARFDALGATAAIKPMTLREFTKQLSYKGSDNPGVEDRGKDRCR